MTPSLFKPPYPFHREDARRLHQALSQLYATPKQAVLVAQQAGLDVSHIFADQAPFFVWKDILEAAAVAGLLEPLVQDVRQRLSASSPYRPLLDDLLADRPVPASGEPRDLDGAPQFVHGAGGILEQEALLYRDDLTIQVGALPALIATLQRLTALAPSVCKLTVDVLDGEQFGTAFRIGPDLLLTNWHVLHRKSDGVRAGAVLAEFGYEDDGQGGVRAVIAIACDPASIQASQADDWAVIRAKAPLAAAWPEVRLEEAVNPVLNGAAFVIQHPQGARKRVSIVRNQVSFFDGRVVQYLADTQVGSSGAPVFDAEGRLIALHHAGGLPQEVTGKAPLRKNEGIRISRIIAGMQPH